ncbi:MAG: protein translocase subunit SecF [Treponema sp.]|nr:protein translocase subunit SecF [Treponema sp.]
MEKKFHQFSKAFLPCGIVSLAIIAFGIVGMVTRGINFGLDFKPGLIEEIRIAPAAAELTYNGTAKVTVDSYKGGLDFVISGTGAENETKSYSYAEYATVKDLVNAINVSGVKAVLRNEGSEPSENIFLNSAVTTVLSKNPLYLYAGNEDVSIDNVRETLSSLSGIAVKALGDGGFQIRMPATEEETNQNLQNSVLDTLASVYGAENIAIIKTDFIGSSFSKTLAQKSIILLVVTVLLIWIYAAFRFHWDFALGAIIALVHDALIMFTFIVWSRMEFSTTVLAAVLTIVGYSINDTVVILDRVRSNLRIKKVDNFNQLLDRSLSDTLGRSIITTVTTLFAVISLFVFTTGSIKDFALALMVGLVSGCYSSLFISSGFISLFRRNWKPEYGIHHSLKNDVGVLQMDAGVTV